jgi:hypothetical protein
MNPLQIKKTEILLKNDFKIVQAVPFRSVDTFSLGISASGKSSDVSASPSQQNSSKSPSVPGFM